MRIQKLKWILLAVHLVGVLGANATIVQWVSETPGQDVGSITIDYTDSSTPNKQLYSSVSAGIMNLLIDGVARQGFCIDLQQRSSTSALTYSIEPLSSAPQAWVGPMNAAGANLVQQLWGNYFTGINAQNANFEAASLQVAIWKAVGKGNGNYTVLVGNASVNSRAQFMIDNLDESKSTYLVALRNATAQDYTVVPESSTVIAGALLLLPLGISAVRVLRKTRTA